MTQPRFARPAPLAAALAVCLVALPGVALAQDFSNQLAARKGQMQVMALNLGVLGGMARGQVAYDADLAQVAADNLVALSMLNQDVFWPEGSGNDAIENTKALPAIWADYDDFLSQWDAFGAGALTVQAAAGGGQEALGGAMRDIGRACGACHQSYQAD